MGEVKAFDCDKCHALMLPGKDQGFIINGTIKELRTEQVMFEGLPGAGGRTATTYCPTCLLQVLGIKVSNVRSPFADKMGG